jgi:xanthine dehydrogenase YagT iron-sulfur-binding subunit
MNGYCRLTARRRAALSHRRIAQFGRGLAGDVSRRLLAEFAEFGQAVAEAAAASSVPVGPVKAPSAAGLLMAVLAGRLRRLFRRFAR